MMSMAGSAFEQLVPRVVARLSALLTGRRLAVWGAGLLLLTWWIYVYTMMVPGYIDRAGRFKGTDYIQFYVMGSLVLEGRTDALYDGEAHLVEGRRRIDPELRLHALHPNYGPQVALAFAPLALLPFGWSLAVFLVGMAVCYGLSVWIVWRECPSLHDHGRLVALLAAASPVFLAAVRYAQLSPFSLLLWSVAFVALRRNRNFAAGLAIGCLAFKPQLGLVAGIVLLVAREWRVVAGAIAAAAGQIGLAWLVAGTAALAAYGNVLWMLVLQPGLVQIHPSEFHSLRGFVQLLNPSSPVLAACSAAGIVVALIVAARSWESAAPVGVRWGQMVLLTILASPHLLTYDLILLTLPLLVLADWSIRHPGHPRQPAVGLLLVGLYLAPFSSQLARLTRVQLSVVVMSLLAWSVYRICTREPRGRVEARAT